MKLLSLLEHATLADAGWQAAVVIGNKTYTADDHFSAYSDCFGHRGTILNRDEIDEVTNRRETGRTKEGFLSPEGTFLTREQAIARWRTDRNVQKRERNFGDSGDLHRSPHLIGF